MEDEDPPGRVFGDTSTSVQHRCPRMADHFYRLGQPGLPVPCDRCYSVVVTMTVIPYRKRTGWVRSVPA